MEHGEGKNALLAVELCLQRAHTRRQRPRGGGTEHHRADECEPDRGCQAEQRHDDAERGNAELRRTQAVHGVHALQRGEAERGADAEQRDQHAELGVARVEHRAHEVDAEREEGAEPERDRDRCR